MAEPLRHFVAFRDVTRRRHYVIVAPDLLGNADEHHVNGSCDTSHCTSNCIALVRPRTDALAHEFYRQLGLLRAKDVLDGTANDAVLGNHADTFETDYRIRRPDGEIRWIFGRGRLIREASGQAVRYSGIDIDITERKAGEVAIDAERIRELGASRAQIKAIFDNSPDWLTLFRAAPDGRFVYVDLNRATERAYGLSYDQIETMCDLGAVFRQS